MRIRELYFMFQNSKKEVKNKTFVMKIILEWKKKNVFNAK